MGIEVNDLSFYAMLWTGVSIPHKNSQHSLLLYMATNEPRESQDQVVKQSTDSGHKKRVTAAH